MNLESYVNYKASNLGLTKYVNNYAVKDGVISVQVSTQVNYRQDEKSEPLVRRVDRPYFYKSEVGLAGAVSNALFQSTLDFLGMSLEDLNKEYEIVREAKYGKEEPKKEKKFSHTDRPVGYQGNDTQISRTEPKEEPKEEEVVVKKKKVTKKKAATKKKKVTKKVIVEEPVKVEEPASEFDDLDSLVEPIVELVGFDKTNSNHTAVFSKIVEEKLGKDWRKDVSSAAKVRKAMIETPYMKLFTPMGEISDENKQLISDLLV